MFQIRLQKNNNTWALDLTKTINTAIYQEVVLRKQNATSFSFFCHAMKKWLGLVWWTFNSNYTLSHPENDRDVTEHAQGYTMRQSRCSFLNAWEDTQVARAMTSVFLWNARWRHGRSRGETKYRGNTLVWCSILVFTLFTHSGWITSIWSWACPMVK